MSFTSIHPAVLPTPPPPVELPTTPILTATNLTFITRFIFPFSTSIDDEATEEGKVWRSILDGLWLENRVYNIYWGLEERLRKQDENYQGVKEVILAVGR